MSNWEQYTKPGWGTLGQARVERMYHFIHRSGPYERVRGYPTPYEIAREFDVDLATARRLDDAHTASTGVGGRGEDWFIKTATRILKEAP